MRLRNYSLLGLLLFVATLFAWPRAEARDSLTLLNAHQVSPNSQIVEFRQTQFVFTAGRSLNTDWGQVNIDLENMKLRRMLGFIRRLSQCHLACQFASGRTILGRRELADSTRFGVPDRWDFKRRIARRTDRGYFPQDANVRTFRLAPRLCRQWASRSHPGDRAGFRRSPAAHPAHLAFTPTDFAGRVPRNAATQQRGG